MFEFIYEFNSLDFLFADFLTELPDLKLEFEVFKSYYFIFVCIFVSYYEIWERTFASLIVLGMSIS